MQALWFTPNPNSTMPFLKPGITFSKFNEALWVAFTTRHGALFLCIDCTVTGTNVPLSRGPTNKINLNMMHILYFNDCNQNNKFTVTYL